MEIKDLYQKVIDAKKQDLKDDPDFDEKIREYDKYLKEETADMTDEEAARIITDHFLRGNARWRALLKTAAAKRQLFLHLL